MKLPNAQRAVVDIEKLRDYCLNPNHPKGKFKAAAFQEKLGLVRDDAEFLRRTILGAVLNVDAVEHLPTQYGRRYVVDFELQRGSGAIMFTAVIRTAWIVRQDEDFPRLVTCYTPRRSA